jgi:hypothetical protein
MSKESLYFADASLTGTTILRYPPSIVDNGIPYVMFGPYQRNTTVTTTNVFTELPAPLRRIVLPLPSSALTTKYGVNYKDTSLGAIGAAIAGGKNLLSDIQADSQIDAAQLTQDVAGILGSQGVYGVFGALGAVTGGEALQDAAQLTLGMTPNPYTEVLFENVPFREHTFTYVFHPKSEQESQLIDDIVQYFKYYMLPSISGGTTGATAGTFLRFPLEWQIIYSIGTTTFSVLPSVLTSMDVSYAEGVDSPKLFTKTNNKRYPTKTNITMTFKEVMLLNRDLIALPVGGTRLDGEEGIVRDANDTTSTKVRYRF